MIDEHYVRRWLIDQHAKAIKSRPWKIRWTTADHDAQGNAELVAHGIPTINAVKDITRGIQAVKARLNVQPDGKPRLRVFSTCINTIREFGMYRWQDPKEGRNMREVPLDEGNHSMDALRYMCMRYRGYSGPGIGHRPSGNHMQAGLGAQGVPAPKPAIGWLRIFSLASMVLLQIYSVSRSLQSSWYL